MRAKDANQFALPASEQVTVPELGGDGIVTVHGLGFGKKIDIATDPRPEFRAALLAEATVLDDDGKPVLSAEAWDAFGQQHEEQFVQLLQVARRLSGFDTAAVKKA
jgi:hypothetical protein